MEATEPSKRAPEAFARANRLLEAAGRALDPNGPGGKDAELAQRHLRSALIEAAAGLAAAPPVDLDDALAVFEKRGALEKAAGSAERSRELTESLKSEHPADLEPAELFVAKLIESAEGKRSFQRGERVRRVLLLVVSLVAITSIIVFEALRYPHYFYRYKVSSTNGDFPAEGLLGETHEFGLVFHTQQEKEPWVEIDLNDTRAISRVTIRHRTDCCTDRGLPLIVETAGDDKKWEEVARRDESFDKWTATFSTRPARYVRLRSTADTVLHFSEVVVK